MSFHQEHEHTFHDQQVVWKYHHLAATESVKNFDADYSHILGKKHFLYVHHKSHFILPEFYQCSNNLNSQIWSSQ